MEAVKTNRLKMFRPVVIQGTNLEMVADMLRDMFAGKVLSAKVTHWDRSVDILENIRLYNDDRDCGITMQLSSDRPQMTVSCFLGMVFEGHSISFETGNDVILERVAPDSVEFTNTKEPGDTDNIRMFKLSLADPAE